MYEREANQGSQSGRSGAGTLGQSSGTQARPGAEQQTQGRIFVNNQPVQGIQEQRPTVRQILEAAGQETENVQVFRLKGREDAQGQKLSLDERVDAQQECYLRAETEGTEGEESKRALGVSDIRQEGGPGGGREGSSQPRTGGRGTEMGTPGGSNKTGSPGDPSRAGRGESGGNTTGQNVGASQPTSGGNAGATGGQASKQGSESSTGGSFQRGQPAGGTNVGSGAGEKSLENESATGGRSEPTDRNKDRREQQK